MWGKVLLLNCLIFGIVRSNILSLLGVFMWWYNWVSLKLKSKTFLIIVSSILVILVGCSSPVCYEGRGSTRTYDFILTHKGVDWYSNEKLMEKESLNEHKIGWRKLMYFSKKAYKNWVCTLNLMSLLDIDGKVVFRVIVKVDWAYW